jgi:hypothetical protein
MSDTDIVGIDSEEWEELRQEQEDALLSEVADAIAEAINYKMAPGVLEQMTSDAQAMMTLDGVVVDLPMGSKTVRLTLEVLNDDEERATPGA